MKSTLPSLLCGYRDAFFCCKYLKVANRYLTLANQLHEGYDIYLSQLILGSLYESLEVAIDALKNLKPKDNMLLSGPFWWLQLWMNAMFEISMDVDKPNDANEIIKNRCAEGVRLTQMNPTDKNRSNWEALSSYFLMFAKSYPSTHDGSFYQTNSWSWVVYLEVSYDRRTWIWVEEIWEAFLTPKIFSTRLGTSKENVKILCHKPNLVSCQFGIIQIVPKPFFNRKSELCICTIDYSKDEYLQRLSQHANDHDVLTMFAANAK